jgi:hypothetical protein
VTAARPGGAERQQLGLQLVQRPGRVLRPHVALGHRLGELDGGGDAVDDALLRPTRFSNIAVGLDRGRG